ncbi:MAG: hypothetical protein IVW52_17455 [Acidimicrobiales bacterium]|nr:hypothetical protein [Acidimicrobiales bacterium]
MPDGTLFVDGAGAVVLEWTRVRVVELPVPELDPPELQDARAMATTTSTD